jgi:hypothetical protein
MKIATNLFQDFVEKWVRDVFLPFQARQCQCPACQRDAFVHGAHASDCAVHNAPALPIGECDCGVRV